MRFPVASFRFIHGEFTNLIESVFHPLLSGPTVWSAVPIGKPITTIAHNTSATSLYISWKPPPPDTILGEFLGYRITYRTRDKHTNDLREIYIRDSGVEVSLKIISWRKYLSTASDY